MPKPKGGKSSASSATRKKQAAKAAKKAGEGGDGPPAAANRPPQRGQKKDKSKKKEPKKKVFIPPPKPPQGLPDPLDTLGLASQLPGDLVVLLRKAGKKDVVTRQRALEGLLAWVQDAIQLSEAGEAADAGEKESALILSLPCWTHLFPRLATSPTRRLRMLTAQIHLALTRSSLTRAELLESPHYMESLLGPWAVLAWDTDAQVARYARQSWLDCTQWGSKDDAQSKVDLTSEGDTLVAHLSRAVTSPVSILQAQSDPQFSQHQSGANTPAAGDEDLRDAKNRDENVEETVLTTQARLTAGALGALAWAFASDASFGNAASDEDAGTSAELSDEVDYLLHSDQLWACFDPPPLDSRQDEVAATSPSENSPATRARAWALASALTKHRKALFGDLLRADARGAHILRSAWIERDVSAQKAMLEAVAPMLIAYRDLWESGAPEDGDADEGSEDDEEEDDGSDDEGRGGDIDHVSSPQLSSVYLGFLEWLRAGCGNSPAMGFPAVIVLTSTLPDSLMQGSSAFERLQALFNSLYAALESHALDVNPPGVRAFIASLCETLVFYCKRVCERSDQGPALAAKLLSAHLGQVWKELIMIGALAQEDQKRAGLLETRVQAIGDDRLANEVGKAMATLASSSHGNAMLEPLLKALGDILEEALESPSETSPSAMRAASRASTSLAHLGASSCAKAFLPGLMQRLAERCHQKPTAFSVELLIQLLKSLPPELISSAEASDALASISTASLPAAVLAGSVPPGTSARYLAAYMPLCTDSTQRKNVWAEATSSVAKLPTMQQQAEVLVELYATAQTLGQADLGESVHALDAVAVAFASHICSSMVSSSASIVTAAKRLVSKPAPFIETSTSEEMLTLLLTKIEHQGREVVSAAIRREPEGVEAFDALTAPLEVLSAYLLDDPSKRVAYISDSDALSGVIPRLFGLSFLFADGLLPQTAAAETAAALWKLFRQNAQAQQLVIDSIQEHLLDTLGPLAVMHAAARHFGADGMQVILPDAPTWDSIMKDSLREGVDPELSIMNPLYPHTALDGPSDVPNAPDDQGLFPYTRAALTLLEAAKGDDSLLSRRPWTLKHLVILAMAAEDAIGAPSSHPRLFAKDCALDVLRRIFREATALLTKFLASALQHKEPHWHTKVISALKGEIALETSDPVAFSLHELAFLGPLASLYARAFRRLLTGSVRFASTDEKSLEAWLKYAQGQQNSPIASAIIIAVKADMEGHATYVRMCNDAVARLSGVPSSKAASDGLALLRQISVLAPAPESSAAFVPQQRAIFALQNVQKWLASDDEIPEEINTRLAELCVILLPVVQNVAGSHFDFALDLIESNLEVSSLSDKETLPCLYQSLQLLVAFRDIASRNATVRETWNERRKESLEVIHGLFLSLAEIPLGRSIGRDMCIDLLLDLESDVPSSRFRDSASSTALAKLLLAESQQVQVAAFRRLQANAREAVSELVVELALAKDGEPAAEQFRLPVEILATISNNCPSTLLADGRLAPYRLFGYFLSWFVVFEHFEGASMQLSSKYIEDLQRRGLISDNLLPAVFALLGETSLSKPFETALWTLDEIFLSFLDVQNGTALQCLAAHAYFRALLRMPTLVRNWWYDLRDRQLSTLVERFTTRHCTPLIAARELSHLGEGDALARLQDENMAVKVLSTNEIVATYTVDEHPMEIGVKIPADFPLHGVEIKDIKRVGVSEAQWRAWILAVQQLITSRNGLVFDALMLFKKNAEAKFAGYEGAECAICYSIISPTDQSLPNKPCKTCKNKFHGQCLYKWVSTSGGSTCPLCRSIL